MRLTRAASLLFLGSVAAFNAARAAPIAMVKDVSEICHSEQMIDRVRRICLELPETTEKLSHGEPTFFVRKRVFAMFSNNHHNDGHTAVWLPVPPGMQELMIADEPRVFYRPPYVGAYGWVGAELAHIDDERLGALIRASWNLIEQKARHKGKRAPIKNS